MKHLLLLLLFPLLALAQTPEYKQAVKNRDKYLMHTKPVQKKFVKTIPFNYEPNRQIIVPVVINGKTYNFLFDTGASTVISDEILAELSLPALFKNNFEDGAAQVQLETVYNLPALQVAGIDFKNVAVVSADMKRFGTTSCINIDGLLGVNVMRNCYWKVDYNNGILTFSDKEIKPGEGLYPVDFKENFSGSPLLETFMFGYSVFMLMDTGYNGAITVSDSLYLKSMKPHAKPYKKGYGTNTVTIYEGNYKERYLSLTDSVYLGNKRHLILNGLTDVEPANSFLLGNKIFKGYGEMILDWKRHRLYLPEKVVNGQDFYATYGFSPIFTGTNLVVSVVWNGTDAATAGLKPGFVITALNNHDTTNITQEQWCELLEIFRDSKSPQITVKVQDGAGTVTTHTFNRIELLR